MSVSFTLTATMLPCSAVRLRKTTRWHWRTDVVFNVWWLHTHETINGFSHILESNRTQPISTNRWQYKGFYHIGYIGNTQENCCWFVCKWLNSVFYWSCKRRTFLWTQCCTFGHLVQSNLSECLFKSLNIGRNSVLSPQQCRVSPSTPLIV